MIYGCSNHHKKEVTYYEVQSNDYTLKINKQNFGLSFYKNETIVAPSHSISGLSLNGSQVNTFSKYKQNQLDTVNNHFLVANTKGDTATVSVSFKKGVVAFCVNPKTQNTTTISMQLGGMSVAHGLGDAGAFEDHFNLVENEKDVYPIINDGGGQRWASTFSIFPKNNLAGVYFDEGKKEVTISSTEYTMGITTKTDATFYYFLGTPEEIYKNYKSVRAKEGFVDVQPKFRLFELGWESWDALGWNSNQETVKQMLQKFIENDYPIKWAVTGSGFWEKGGTTTSFGKWGDKFSDVKTFKNWMHQSDIKWMIGLRTNFIPSGGPYYPITDERDGNLKVDAFKANALSDEAVTKGYFLKNEVGETIKKTSSVFPIVPSYLLDGRIESASEWFANQYEKWDVDGIKEDTMMHLDSLTDIYDKPVREISKQGSLVMARNGSFSAPGTLLRINDVSINDLSKRLPINYLQYASSGFPNVYSDVVGKHNMQNTTNTEITIRHAWLLALTAGLAVGTYPENWPEEALKSFKKAIDFHYQFAPYKYSVAINGYHSGFPETLTPLSIAFPEEDEVFQLDNFQWMIGKSILATPLLKNHQSGKMDVYLPKGIWYDYDTDKLFKGPKTLTDYKIPLSKTPCFIGGDGILLFRNKQNNTLTVKLYPIQKNKEIVFYGQDGSTKSKITINNPDWNAIKVIDKTTGNTIAYKQVRKHFEFEFVEGHHYLIE